MPTRRFFFDDGSSRKQWQISQRGSKHTVAYGRIGGKLRSTEKSFDSPADARSKTQSLIESKLGAGYTEIETDNLSIKRPARQPLATAADIRGLEKRLGVKLPSEYRTFLRTQNGGIPDPAFVAVPGVPHIANVHVGSLYGLYPKDRLGQSLTWAIEHQSPVLPSGHLPIAYGGDIFTLSLNRHFGCVYFWDHETDTFDNDEKFVQSDGHLLAGSFDEFLARIATFSEY